jgi:arsenate reductase
MAEGLFRAALGPGWEVCSAGARPSRVRPEAIEVMGEIGIDLSGHRSKATDEFLGQEFDYIVTVCDNARDACPVFPGKAERIHWSLPDPEGLDGFRAVRDQLASRIGEFAATVART